MRETFTEQQREIVARKMGYDGPMQMFDEYLASTPSDANRYSAITSKYAVKMAQGGVVKMVAGGSIIDDSEFRPRAIQTTIDPAASQNGIGGEGASSDQGGGASADQGNGSGAGTDTGAGAGAGGTGSDAIPVAPTATVATAATTAKPTDVAFTADISTKEAAATAIPVSYTHLTLPTSP
jgi:hypothetical protein